MDNILNPAVMSGVVWVISTTVTRARIFEPLREAIKKRSSYWHEGVSCQYCVSHWVAVGMAFLVRGQVIFGGLTPWPICDRLVTALAWVAGSAVLARTLGRIDDRSKREL